jgi:hypothetical protein
MFAFLLFGDGVLNLNFRSLNTSEESFIFSFREYVYANLYTGSYARNKSRDLDKFISLFPHLFEGVPLEPRLIGNVRTCASWFYVDISNVLYQVALKGVCRGITFSVDVDVDPKFFDSVVDYTQEFEFLSKDLARNSPEVWKQFEDITLEDMRDLQDMISKGDTRCLELLTACVCLRTSASFKRRVVSLCTK